MITIPNKIEHFCDGLYDLFENLHTSLEILNIPRHFWSNVGSTIVEGMRRVFSNKSCNTKPNTVLKSICLLWQLKNKRPNKKNKKAIKLTQKFPSKILKNVFIWNQKKLFTLEWNFLGLMTIVVAIYEKLNWH